jgi:hypothetical protein
MKLEWVQVGQAQVWVLRVDGVVKARASFVRSFGTNPSHWRFGVSPANLDHAILHTDAVRGESATLKDAQAAAEVILKHLHPVFLLPEPPRQRTLSFQPVVPSA